MASYRDEFTAPGSARRYDEQEYRLGSTSANLWVLEQGVLDRVLASVPSRPRALDFACGSGRILEYLVPRCGEVTGIDVSAEMLAKAAERARAAKLLQRDITAPDAALEGRYDLITAFRFFLNAEPPLRRAAMKALANRLAGPESRLVMNTHGNPWSYKLLGLPLGLMRKNAVVGKLLSARALAGLASEVGLEVVERYGFGFIPGRLARFLPGTAGLTAERWLQNRDRLAPVGVEQILVCRLASHP